MCGIAGFCNPEFDWFKNINRMNDRMYRRGPDASGIWSTEDKSVVLGHRRLSIVDLTSGGIQPMESHNKRYVMVYNGEIYNYREIGEKLIIEKKTTAFKSTSDTEVLLEAVSAYGLENTLKMCKGMFALAVYDKKERTLSLARDRVGEKPLYYGFTGKKTFVFASDLNSLTCLDNFNNPVNKRILETYFRYGYIPVPYSIYEGIYKLEPGKMLKIKSPFDNSGNYTLNNGRFNNGSNLNGNSKLNNTSNIINSDKSNSTSDLIGSDKSNSTSDLIDSSNLDILDSSSKLSNSSNLNINCNSNSISNSTSDSNSFSASNNNSCFEITEYWSMSQSAYYGQTHLFKGSEEEAAQELERLLKNSIKGQLAADVPVGAFLSAGIDSSTIVSLMQEVSDKNVRTFTIGMNEEGFNEAEIAGKIARHLGTEHTELYITQDDAKQVIPKLGEMFGEPFADSSQIPTYLVSRMTREHVTVSLSGDGGDELFCGYQTYKSIGNIWRKINKIPHVIKMPVSRAILHSPWGRGGSLAIRARLLGAAGIEDIYRRSEIGEGINLLSKEVIGELAAEYAGSAGDDAKGMNLYLGSAKTVMDTYPDAFLQEPLHNLMLMDMLMYHPDDILTKVDRCAMAVSLETRVPMLDKDVVEFAWTLPIAYKKDGDITKKILRDILYKYVPKELMERPKKGFSIPLHIWLKEPQLKEWAEALIDRRKIKEQGLLNPDAVWKLWDDFIERGIWRQQIWYVLMFMAGNVAGM